MRDAFRIMLVALVLWAPQLCPAAEPLSLAEAMQERSALGRALTNQFARPGEKPSAEGSPIGLNLAAALLAAAAFAAHRLAPMLKRRFGSWILAPANPADLVPTMLEEPSLIAFFEALKDGPAWPVAGGASLATETLAPSTAPAADAVPDPLREFYDATLWRLAELRRLLSEISRAPDEAARQTRLLESSHLASVLRESAGLPEVLPIWQVGFALEGLLKRLATKPADLSPSVVQTATGALDLLERLCHQRVKPDLVTEPPFRLLAVDDNPISRCAMSQALAKLFNAPDLAPDGHTALALAGRQTYDAIFLDVEMPGMDGFELCVKIRETKLNCTTPVVFVTRHSDFASHARSKLNGGYDLLGKPFLVFELVLKAITLVLQVRLGPRVAEPRSASNDVSKAPAPPALAAPCATVEPPAGGLLKALAMKRNCKSSISNLLGILGSWPMTRSKRNRKLPMNRWVVEREPRLWWRVRRRDTLGTGETPARLFRVSGSAAHGASKRQRLLSADVLAPLQALQMQLQAAQQDAAPADYLEFLGELYVHVHAASAGAQRADLGAAFRLGSALESMLKKLLEQPNSWTPSTVQAAATAIELLLDIGRTGENPDLASPPVQILVVDDEPVARRAICGSLQLAFGRPDSVEGGEAALRLANEKAFDLIFLDVRMAGMDGFAACSQIHQTRHNPRTPVVFVTSYDDLDSRAKAAAAGGWGFIPKGVMASQIKLVALTFVLHGRMGRQIRALAAAPSLAGSGSEPAPPAQVSLETTPPGFFTWATPPVSSKSL